MPKMTECSICGGRMEMSRNTKPGHAPAHNRCRTKAGGIHECGLSGYRFGCRCDVCKSAKATAIRAYAASVRESTGVHPATLQRRRFRDEFGFWPNRRGADWIAPADRAGLYERDGWMCLLCDLPIDREAHWNDDLAPSLDHIVPRSLGGTHDPVNLRTAHRICNSVRGAEYELA